MIEKRFFFRNNDAAAESLAHKMADSKDNQIIGLDPDEMSALHEPSRFYILSIEVKDRVEYEIKVDPQ